MRTTFNIKQPRNAPFIRIFRICQKLQESKKKSQIFMISPNNKNSNGNTE